MVEAHRIVIVGDSLFTESLSHLITNSGTVTISGTAATIGEAIALIDRHRPDALIVADVVVPDWSHLGPVLEVHPDLPILCADLQTNYVLVITGRRIHAHPSGFLAALAALPSRAT